MSNGSRPTLYSREAYMCNLCAETREMWKKSGAWFFKSLPKYILPEKRATSRYNDTELARSLQVCVLLISKIDKNNYMYFRVVVRILSRFFDFEIRHERDSLKHLLTM